MAVTLGGFNMWGEETQAALEAYLASLETRGPTPLQIAGQGYAARIAEEQAEAARVAEAQAAAQAAAQAEAVAQAEAAAQAQAAQAAAQAEADAAQAAADAALQTAITTGNVGLFSGPNMEGSGGYYDVKGAPPADEVAAAEAALEAAQQAAAQAAQAAQAAAAAQQVAEQQAAAAAQADAIANPPFDTDIYEKSDGYYYYQDEDGNEIDIGTRKEDRAASMLDKYEEVVNEDLTPLTDTSAYVGEDGEPKEGYRFGEDGTVFQDIGDTWAQVYVNEDGENVAKDTGREKFRNAVDWEKGAEGERNEGLGGAINKFLDSSIAQGLLAVATGGLSVPYTAAASTLKGVSDGNLNAFQAFAGLGGFASLTDNIIKSLPDILGKDPSKELVNTIKAVGSAATPKDIALSALGIDEVIGKFSEDIANAIGKDTGLSTGAVDGIANTITSLVQGQDFDSAVGGALTTFATTPKEEIEKKIDAASIVDAETLDAMSEAETGATTTPTTDETNQFATAGGASGDQVDTGSIFYPPDVDTDPLSQPTGDDPTADPATIAPEGDAPVIGDTPELGTPSDTDTSTPVIKTAEEELADLGLTDGAPPTRPDAPAYEDLYGPLYSEDADNSLTFKGTDADKFIKELAKSESSGDYQNEYSFINEEGKLERYVGLLQFGEDRLKKYKKEFNVDFTLDEFKNDNDLQDKVNLWHINDLDERYDQIDRNKTLDAGVTKDGFRAMAHLGGRTGAINFINTGGEYNPDDKLGTTLSRYNDKFGGAFIVPTTDTQIEDAKDTFKKIFPDATDAEINSLVDFGEDPSDISSTQQALLDGFLEDKDENFAVQVAELGQENSVFDNIYNAITDVLVPQAAAGELAYDIDPDFTSPISANLNQPPIFVINPAESDRPTDPNLFAAPVGAGISANALRTALAAGAGLVTAVVDGVRRYVSGDQEVSPEVVKEVSISEGYQELANSLALAGLSNVGDITTSFAPPEVTTDLGIDLTPDVPVSEPTTITKEQPVPIINPATGLPTFFVPDNLPDTLPDILPDIFPDTTPPTQPQPDEPEVEPTKPTPEQPAPVITPIPDLPDLDPNTPDLPDIITPSEPTPDTTPPTQPQPDDPEVEPTKPTPEQPVPVITPIPDLPDLNPDTPDLPDIITPSETCS